MVRSMGSRQVWTVWVQYKCKDIDDIVLKYNTKKQAESKKARLIKADHKISPDRISIYSAWEGLT